jgi:hypothetical protein
MNRRGFIHSALAATLGVAAGVVLPSTPIEKVVKTVSKTNYSATVFKEIKFIVDDECPEDVVYLFPASFKWKVKE